MRPIVTRQRTRLSGWSSIVLAAVLLAAACATAGRRADESGGEEAPRDAVRVRVINQTDSEMHVHVLTETSNVHLGTVRTLDTATFRLPGTLAGPGSDIRLLADPVGSDRVHISASVSPTAGELVEWTILSSPALSSMTIVVKEESEHPRP